MARAGATCTAVRSSNGPQPHVGGTVAVGSLTVLIGGLPAARQGDAVMEAGGPNAIAAGAPDGADRLSEKRMNEQKEWLGRGWAYPVQHRSADRAAVAFAEYEEDIQRVDPHHPRARRAASA